MVSPGWRKSSRYEDVYTFEGFHAVGRIFNSRHFDQELQKVKRV
jgi:hypothetical protein